MSDASLRFWRRDMIGSFFAARQKSEVVNQAGNERFGQIHGKWNGFGLCSANAIHSAPLQELLQHAH